MHPVGPTWSGLTATKSPFRTRKVRKADAPLRKNCDASGLAEEEGPRRLHRQHRLRSALPNRLETRCPAQVAAAEPIPVVCAVIEDDSGRVLLAQRPAHKHLGLKWEFPGGKVEPGESPEGALCREISEELGCTITITRALPRVIHDYGTMVIEMIPFACTLAEGSAAPHPHEHVAVRWVPWPEIDGSDLAPADRPVVASMRA